MKHPLRIKIVYIIRRTERNNASCNTFTIKSWKIAQNLHWKQVKILTLWEIFSLQTDFAD